MLVCQGRAAADGRLAPGVFSDPVAIELLREDERVPVELVRAGTPPSGAAARLAYESVRAAAGSMVPRTVAIDAAIAARPCPQLVVLGAGLDDRAWRMRELADVDVLEVDHPASQADKRDRVGGLPLGVPVAGVGRGRLHDGLVGRGPGRRPATTARARPPGCGRGSSPT